MRRKWMLVLLAMLLCAQGASAQILPASGVDQDFASRTGLECTPAVVLCESLSVLDERGDQGGKRIEMLYYSGKTIPVIESWDGYAKIYYADGTKTGWVRNEYLLMDPAWYVCDEDLQAYAYPDVMAPRIAFLGKGKKLPILTEYDDGISVAGWVCVSLRGAAGWIRKTPGDTASRTWFRPEMLGSLAAAELSFGEETIRCTERAQLGELSRLLTDVEDYGAMVAGCPFTAALALELTDGRRIELALATDSCCVYRVDGRDYAYARNLGDEEEGGADNAVLYELFGVSPQLFWPK